MVVKKQAAVEPVEIPVENTEQVEKRVTLSAYREKLIRISTRYADKLIDMPGYTLMEPQLVTLTTLVSVYDELKNDHITY